MKTEHVPCAGCTACCQHDLIFLHPENGDRPEAYAGATEIATNPFTGESGLALKKKPEGGCWYVGEHGCTIHGFAPAICREFDCRKMLRGFMQIPRAERRRLQRKLAKRKLMSEPVMEAARARMHTLPDR